MELRQIYYVLEVARTRSFSKASSALYITQPAISHQINALEDELHVRLFNRDTHSVTLTEDGEKFCSYAIEIVRIVDDLMNAFDKDTSKNKTSIRIGIFPFYKATGFQPVISSFFIKWTNVVGSIATIENYKAYEDLKAGNLDFAIIKVKTKHIPSWLEYDVLRDEIIHVLISTQNPYAQQEIIRMEQLGDLALLTGEKGSFCYNVMEKIYKEQNVDFNVSFMNNTEVDMIIDMVEAGIGVNLATESVGKVYANEKIASIPLEPKLDIQTVLVYPKKKKLTGAYLDFRNYIVSKLTAEKQPESEREG